jgi:hypothetical protein
LSTENGIGVEFGAIAIAAAAFAFATVEPGTSEFGISAYMPPDVPICAGTPPMPSICEGDGSTPGSLSIAALAFAFAADDSAVGELGISLDVFP